MKKYVPISILGLVIIALLYFLLSRVELNNWQHWEHWSYFATTLGLLSVLINSALLWTVFIQIREGRKSYEIAQAAVRESTRARVDDKAPRVIAIMGQPTIHGQNNGNSVITIPKDPIYIMPKMKDVSLHFIVTGELINEGKSTARIKLNGNGVCFLDGEEDDDPIFDTTIVTSQEERTLRPSETIRFIWSDGRRIADWVDAFNKPDPPNPRGSCQMEVIVRDFFKDGIIDNIHIEMCGRPLIPVEGEEGRWQHGKAGSIVATSHYIHRTYLQEGWKGVIPPWVEIYKAYSEQQASKNKQT